MTEPTVWSTIPSQAILGFFGFFAFASVFSAYIRYFENYKSITAVIKWTMIISALFWFTTFWGILLGFSYIFRQTSCSIYDYVGFFSFSIAWLFGSRPTALFWRDLYKAVKLKNQSENEVSIPTSQFIAIHHYDYESRWYWILRTSGEPLRISPCDNTSEESCRERISGLQADESLPECPVILGGVQQPPNYQDRPICDE